MTGDPALLLVEPGASQADIETVREQLGLDQSLVVQYVKFMSGLLRGDLAT